MIASLALLALLALLFCVVFYFGNGSNIVSKIAFKFQWRGGGVYVDYE